MILGDIKIEKVPSLTCKKCGSIRVMMTGNGPECEECDEKPPSTVELSLDVEYFISQINQEETEEDETF
jgi:hypothetical protein